MSATSVFDIIPLSPRNGAELADIEAVESELNRSLPADYKQFLMESNGLEGFIKANVYLIMWSVQDIASLNIAYATFEFVPGLVLLGTNGGNTGYGFLCNQYVQVPLVGMSLDVVETIGNTFIKMVEQLKSSDK